jgi:DNA (cytosine-5)-methyltransferase 1
MIENVKGLAGTKHRDYLMAVVAKLEALGYETRWRVLNASHYGVAQTRERIFVVAFRGRANFEWPGQLGPVATTRDALGVMPEALGTCSDGGKTKMPPHRPIRSLDQPCMTIRAQHKAGGTGVLVVGTTTMPNAERFLYSDGTTSPTRYPPRHPVTYSVRRLTTVEAAAIQGFPTGYPFFGTTTSRYRQIGNAVPPGLSEAVGRNIIKALTATAAPNPLLTRACIL